MPQFLCGNLLAKTVSEYLDLILLLLETLHKVVHPLLAFSGISASIYSRSVSNAIMTCSVGSWKTILRAQFCVENTSVHCGNVW